MTRTLEKKLKVIHSTRKLDILKPTEYNPRKISQKAKKKLRKSLLDFGYIDPIIINTFKSRENIIISGHQRYYIMKEDLVEEVDVIEVNVNKNKEKLLNIAMNNRNLMGDWDEEKLTEVMGELFNDNQDLSLSGFDELELDKILEPLGLLDNEKDDLVPEVPKEPVSKTGDLYLLGRHRLLCGDSTKKEDVNKLMVDEKVDMVFTDPPYNVDYGSSKRKKGPNYQKGPPSYARRKIIGDAISDEEWIEFNQKIIDNIKNFNKGDIYIWAGPSPDGMRQRLQLVENGAHWSATIIWKKDQLVLTPAKYQRIYEPCFYGWFNESSFCADRKQVELWEIPRPKDSKLHPTMKPIILCSKAIKNSSKKDDIVLDFFGGSGSTLIACEKTNRICYMMEIDPHYVDVIVKRWEDYTGLKAKLVKTNA